MVLFRFDLSLVLPTRERLDFIYDFRQTASNVDKFVLVEGQTGVEAHTGARPHLHIRVFRKHSTIQIHSQTIILLVRLIPSLWQRRTMNEFIKDHLAEALVALGLYNQIFPSHLDKGRRDQRR